MRTIRKRNGIIGFGSQAASDIAGSRIADSLIEQSPTQIFMPNAMADEQVYRGRFKLTAQEFDLIKNKLTNTRCCLIKHGNHSVIVQLDLGGMDDILAILSGRTETIALLDRVRAEVGDDPRDWIPLFHQRRKEP